MALPILPAFVLSLIYWPWILAVGAILGAVAGKRRRVSVLLAYAAVLVGIGLAAHQVPAGRLWVSIPLMLPVLLLLKLLGF